VSICWSLTALTEVCQISCSVILISCVSSVVRPYSCGLLCGTPSSVGTSCVAWTAIFGSCEGWDEFRSLLESIITCGCVLFGTFPLLSVCLLHVCFFLSGDHVKRRWLAGM
jgi:hypothetical protein